ncbi:MAG: hypothetical protein VYC30_00990 [Pseudomonadota bacterium]|nr:hypothetical protein [Pseudomonadota bacterium]
MQVVDLSHYQFVRVSGPDSIQFLQGQLSCNMESLSTTQSLMGALFNLKGRIVADLRVLLLEGDCYLQTQPNMAEIIISTLAKYSVFSKVKLEIPESSPIGIGYMGNCGDSLKGNFGSLPKVDNAVIKSNDTYLVKIPGLVNRFELWCFDISRVNEFRPDPGPSAASANSNWLYEDIRSGLVHVDKLHSEKYTSQLLNYDISGVVDFDKGCYTGQEIVARTYYRGTPKKRMFLLKSEKSISPDSSVLQSFEGQEKKPAKIVSYCNTENGNLLLAILDAEAITRKAKFLLSDSVTVPLQVMSLPYLKL